MASHIASTTGEVTSTDVGSLASLMHLLPFQRHIIHSLIPGTSSRPENQPADDSDDPDVLLVLARGLGLRTIIASILRLYDGPSNLVILINATTEEENGLHEELTTMGVRKPGLRSIGHETSAKLRQEIYLSGGLLSITSRILIVDMLDKKIPTDLVTGIIVMHAERITPSCIENFIVNLYRQENRDGFLKAFSDAPDFFAMGLSPLQTVLSQLSIRRVELWPRFHKDVIRDLGRRKADVIELRQALSPSMRRIQNAIVECLEATMNELKRGSGSVDIDDATIENAVFQAFEVIIRKQLNPVWHRIGPKTKRLVADLHELRMLINYLLSYDAVKFHRYLETILVGQVNPANNMPLASQNQSPWLMMDAANVIFTEAKARAFVGDIKKLNPQPAPQQDRFDDGIDPDEEAAALDALNESGHAARNNRLWWLPPGIEPTLEELPKWHLLREVLDEIEQDIHTSTNDLTITRNNTVLIMVESERTCLQIREYLSTMKASVLGKASSDGRPGKRLMERQLRDYFEWKQNVGRMSRNLRNPQFATTAGKPAVPAAQFSPSNGRNANYESEALRRKEIWDGGRAPLHKRRRQRGGSLLGSGSRRRDPKNATEALESEAGEVEQFLQQAVRQADGDAGYIDADPDETTQTSVIADHFSQIDFETFFGLLQMEDLIVVRPYSGDNDDHHLQELKPRFVVMYDPDPAFVRRLEVFRTAQRHLDMRIYFLMYAESVEEQRYLSNIRREKESFERLIREKATMALPLQADDTPAEETADERQLRTINSRVAGGQHHQATSEQPRVIVDMREFRSNLPYMLYRVGMQVVPRTLQVGDYILSNKICVERKSLSDLVQSFNSGRLYTQCELMSAYYTHPILLIEFDENKSFSMQTINEAKSNPRTIMSRTKPSEVDVQSKLVLLTITFPRLRIIWSSSPVQTSDTFADLKSTFDEPNAAQVAAIGMEDGVGEEDGTGSGGVSAGLDTSYNLTAQDVLLSLPGITTKNYLLVSRSVRDLADLCSMSREEICHLIGAEPGRRLHDFIHKSVREGGQ